LEEPSLRDPLVLNQFDKGRQAELEISSSSSEDTPVPHCLKRRGIIVVVASLVVCAVSIAWIVASQYFSRRSDPPSTSEFIYVNDIHLDPLYEPFSSSALDPEGFCRVKLESLLIPSPFGQYYCDTPDRTFDSMLAELKRVSTSPRFILFGGDGIAHATGFNRTGVQTVFADVIHRLSSIYPSIPVLVSLGNNEFVPNYGSKETDATDFESIGEILERFMTADQLDTFHRGGYYYHDFPEENLRLLLLNTVMYNYIRDTEDDPYGQFAWIANVSELAKAKGYRIGLAMHIPPAVIVWSYSQGWSDVYVNKFFVLAEKYDFSFVLTAHSHYDTFLPLLNASGGPFKFALSSPSISPQHMNNPAFRVIRYKNGVISDVLQYYADIMMNPQKELKWELEYQFTDAYKVDDLSDGNLLKAVRWVKETSEGMWRYMERIAARASDNAKFYYCVLKAVSETQIDACMADVQSVRRLSPYHDMFD
jgi:sphingomyelin phosphodiesterase acid-like 3